MRLFVYELKKTVFRVSMLVLLAAFLVINLYKLNEIEIMNKRREAPYLIGSMFEDFKGEITPEKVQRAFAYQEKMNAIIASGNYSTTEASDEFYCGYAFGDSYNIGFLLQRMDSVYHYSDQMEALCERADKIVDFYEGRSAYEVNKNEIIKTLYSGRKLRVIGNYYAFLYYFDYEFSSLLVIMLTVFGFAAAFTGEKAVNADKIIISCGRAKDIYIAKHCSMYVFVFAVTLIFSIEDLAFFGSIYGIEFINQPVYAMDGFGNTPCAVTIWGALLISVLEKMTAYFFIGETVMVISSFFRNVGASTAVSLVAVMGLILLNDRLPDYISPISLISFEKQFRTFDTKNIFSLAVPTPAVSFFIGTAVILMLHWICYRRTVPKLETEDEK